MGILSAIWNLIKKIFSAVLGWLSDLFGKFFWIILILVVIWFAPVIATWLVSVGAPSFLVTAFQAISVLTPYVQSAGMWLWTSGSSLVSTAWSAFRGLDAGTQAAVALGAAAAIAPEEMQTLIKEAGSLLADGASAIIDGIVSNPLLLAGAAAAVWFLFFRKKSDTVVVETSKGDVAPQPGV